ncbi:MAG: GMC family oxidoreductase N-terminal domain-containing protein, partial [Myxococcales bacterium]
MNPSFPDEDLPEGTVVDGLALGRPFDDSYDYVVVGSGAAGAVAAHTLAESGASVALVEEGPWVKTRDFGDRVYDAFRGMYREAGTQVLEGDSYIPLIQGACVGGSTVVNSAIAWRPPDEVLVDWQRRFGLGDVASMKVLEPHFDALEAALGARVVQDEVLGENNRIFLEQAEKQGISAVRMRRYERGCRGSGRCMTGCPTAAKQGMNVSYVPWALRLGARIFTSCRVDRVVIVSGRAVGIVARAKSGHPVHLRARRGVLVAASAVQTPNLLRRSGLRARDLGEHFQAHPGLGMGGVFDRPVHMEFGATQGADIEQFRTSDGIKLETISMPPELAAVRIPGIGRELMNRLAVFSNLAVWALIVRSESEGRVTTGWGG